MTRTGCGNSPLTQNRARNARPDRVSGRLLPRDPANFIISPISRHTLGVERIQSPFGDEQIREAEQRKELRRVLGQTLVTRLIHAEDILHDMERVLDLGPNTRLELLDLLVDTTQRRIRQRLALARPHRDFPLNIAALVLFPFLDTLRARIAEDDPLFPVQQGMSLRDVIGAGWRGDQGMGDAGVGIDANVQLHAAVPLVTLLGLVHLRIALATLVLGRGRGGEDALGQFALFQLATKLEQRRGIRCGFPRQIDAHESPDGLTVVDGVFDAFVEKTEALLGDVHAQHAFHADWRSATSFAFGIVRLHLRHQRRPRRYHVDLAQKPVAPRHLLLGRVLQSSKARLHRQVPINFQCVDSRRQCISSIRRFANKSARP